MNVKHNKELVLEMGLDLFCNKGYNNLGIDEICKVTGMTKGAFYNAFKSKEQFLIETILMYNETNTKRITKELHPNKRITAFERLKMFYIKMLEVQPNINFSGCYINNLMSELGFMNETVSKSSNDAFVNFINAIEPTVAEAQKNGEIKNDIDSTKLTLLIHSTFYGILTIGKATQDNQKSIETIQILFNNLKINKK